jgi:4-hydroxy-3-polyprenylbenzoate decarboxylase
MAASGRTHKGTVDVGIRHGARQDARGMGYASLSACVQDLERSGHLVRIDAEVDPYLEAAEIQRRVYRAGGPAVLFARVKGCRFPMVSNLFGTLDRARFLFRDTIETVRRMVELKIDPTAFWRRPLRYTRVPFSALHMLPRVVQRGPVLAGRAQISDLPQMTSWPRDGGPFITLPQVYTEDPDRPVPMKSNLGMYRVQLAGNSYERDREIGLHYQIHRGIGVHHAAALRRGEPLKVSVFVGGPPAMTLAAVMPLPEGLTELMFGGALTGRRVRLARTETGHTVNVDADFVITGDVLPDERKPEGPFGDHLGYYSLAHDFPVLRVRQVYHREDAVWPFTVVGRPPQEDTVFGALIHDLTGPVIPTVLPGVKAVHAVDAAGVHPLLLALGSERYVPWAPREEPQELLTQANAILGQGQLSLAKYLFIAAADDAPGMDLHDVGAFFTHVLERVDWTRDLHFQTRTTIDTLDYSGGGLNRGSKLIVAAVGKARRTLPTTVPAELRLPDGFSDPRVCLPGVLAVRAPAFRAGPDGRCPELARFCAAFDPRAWINSFPLVLLVEDSDFCARSLDNLIWVTFTRSNPAVDVDGIAAQTVHKHWGCHGALVIDARPKPHHAPPLIEDPAVTSRVDALFARGGALHGLED